MDVATHTRLRDSLDNASARIDREQIEDVERLVMSELGMDAATLYATLRECADDIDVDMKAALLFFLWGVQAKADTP